MVNQCILFTKNIIMSIQTFSALLVEHTSKPYKCSFNNLVYQKIPGGGLPDPLVRPLPKVTLQGHFKSKLVTKRLSWLYIFRLFKQF